MSSPTSEEGTSIYPRSRIFQDVNVQNDVRLSTVKIGSGCGKPLGDIYGNSQSDCQGYFSDSGHFDGKPSGNISREIAFV